MISKTNTVEVGNLEYREAFIYWVVNIREREYIYQHPEGKDYKEIKSKVIIIEGLSA